MKAILLTLAALLTSALSGAAAQLALPPGALIHMEMNGTVGVLLDEIPRALRDAAADHVLLQDDAFWERRAASQVELTSYRLVFRGFYYTAPPNRGPLPLPGDTARKIEITGQPHRARIGTHDYVVANYRFSSYIVTDAASPGVSEPALETIGGTWDEPFQLPADPELVLQRSGYACMDEFAFPKGSVFEESVSYFYDQTCQVEIPATSSCHVTEFPTESCTDALTNHIGMVQFNMRFTRVAYEPAVASQYRIGTIVNSNGADLAVVTEKMAAEHSIYYRYFTPDSCEIFEGTIVTPGWRRLLTFSANVRNDGTAPIHIGDVTDPSNPWRQSNVFEFSACHQHYHFSFYGDFAYNGALGLKRAFCLEDTNRYHNDETTALMGPHQTCTFQGIAPGWGDEYQFGISGQWVDITDVDATQPHDLTFKLNAEQFLCEGQTLGANNQPVDPTDLSMLVFDPTSLKDPQGNTISRIRCLAPSNWAADNFGSTSVSSEPGSLINDQCIRGQIGPNRDCGFDAQRALRSCNAGSTVTLQCRTDGPRQVLRICEKSEALGTGVACTFRNSVMNSPIGQDRTTVTFTCPAVRDAAVPGTGGYSVYQGPLLPWQEEAQIECAGL
jgi:hypothetical protein